MKLAQLTAAAMVLATAPLLAASAVSGAAPAPPKCHGRVATVVGTPGHPARGTPHADVIVTVGATVYAGGGDDLICASGRGVVIRAGAGDDRIDARKAINTSADLGPGRDSFLGSPGRDDVDAEGGGTDHVFTLGGGDHVDAGGQKGHADHDLIRLGPGDDSMYGTLDPSTTWYGDAGNDSYTLTAGVHDWDVDVPKHQFLRDGRVVQRFRGFEYFYYNIDYYGEESVRSLSFEGGPEDDTVYVNALVEGQTTLDLAAGDDTVQLITLEPHGVAGDFSRIDGGAGHDLFESTGGCGEDCTIESSAYLKVDLQAHVLGVGQCRPQHSCTEKEQPPRRVGSIKGVEDVLASFYDQADLTGDGGDNRLSAPNSCFSRLAGGAGDDVLDAGAGRVEACPYPNGQPGHDPSPTGSLQSGGPGDDTLIGSYADDHLTGGADTDSADGAGGTDTCDAETTVRCEG